MSIQGPLWLGSTTWAIPSLIIVEIYTEAFQYCHLGYAAALAWLFFIVMFAFTFIQFRSSAGWVYYAGEQEQKE